MTGVLGRGSNPRHSLVGAVPLLNVKKREVMMKEDPIRILLAYWKSLLDVGLDPKEIKDSPLAREYVCDLLHDLFEVIDTDGDFDFDLNELFKEVTR